MAKSRTEKITSYDEQIAKLQEQRKKEVQKQKQDERKERDKRLRIRGEILEKMIPETINLTVEQFTTFLRRSTANTFGRDKLAEIIKEGEAKPNLQVTPSTNEKPSSPLPSSTPNEKATPIQPPQTPPNGNKN